MGDRRRVFVTGMGCLSGLGQGAQANWDAAISGQDAARPFERSQSEGWAVDVSGVAAWMQPPDTSAFAGRFNVLLLGQMDPVSQYAVLAAFEALDGAGLLDRPDLLGRSAVLIGCGAGGLTTIEHSYVRLGRGMRSAHPLTVARLMPSAPASQVSMVFGARGPAFGVTSACASSSHAIAEGAEMVASGRVDMAIVGGAEAALTAGCWLAWQGLRVVAQERCRPFSTGRDGLVLGEGAGVLVLESGAHALARGAPIRGEILSSGATADAHHITQPGGVEAANAIRQALEFGGLSARDPVLISSHGTGTVPNDRAETEALLDVFGETLQDCLVVATKSAHGHLLGAGAAVELILGLLALERQLAPPILNYLGPDPACDAPLALGGPKPAPFDVLISNAFAFGGLNSVIAAARAPR